MSLIRTTFDAAPVLSNELDPPVTSPRASSTPTGVQHGRLARCADDVVLRRPQPRPPRGSDLGRACGRGPAGSLTETQWVECKLAIPAMSPGANAELATDLASLTVDGGVLVIGVRTGRRPPRPSKGPRTASRARRAECARAGRVRGSAATQVGEQGLGAAAQGGPVWRESRPPVACVRMSACRDLVPM